MFQPAHSAPARTVRECTHTLRSGLKCRQFALRGQLWCHNHRQLDRRHRDAHAEALDAFYDSLEAMDLLSLIRAVEHELDQLASRLPAYSRASLAAQLLAARLSELNHGYADTCAQPLSNQTHRLIALK
jgi:hypothetical protein